MITLTPPDMGNLDSLASTDQDITIAITADQAAHYLPKPINKDWYRIQREGRGTINIVVVDNLPEGDFPLLHENLEITNQALRVWQRMTGYAWYLTPATAGSDVLEGMLKQIRPRGATFKPRESGPTGDDATERPYRVRDWRRTEDAPYAFGYDATRCYPAAAGTVECCPWSLKHTGKRGFDPKLAGWWRIQVPAWNDERLPDPAGYGPPVRWVTTPTAKLLWQLAGQGLSGGFTVLDSWTGPGKRIFRTWAELMEQGYQCATEAGSVLLRAAFKEAARESLGKFNSATYTTYRPDWHYSIVAQARTNLWRKIRLVADAEGRWPLSVATDNVRYSSQVPDPVASCPGKLVLGDRLGCFKVKAA